MTQPDHSLFCFGYGYSCDYLAKALQNLPSEWRIGGTTRSETKRDALKPRALRLLC